MPDLIRTKVFCRLCQLVAVPGCSHKQAAFCARYHQLLLHLYAIVLRQICGGSAFTQRGVQRLVLKTTSSSMVRPSKLAASFPAEPTTG